MAVSADHSDAFTELFEAVVAAHHGPLAVGEYGEEQPYGERREGEGIACVAEGPEAYQRRAECYGCHASEAEQQRQFAHYGYCAGAFGRLVAVAGEVADGALVEVELSRLGNHIHSGVEYGEEAHACGAEPQGYELGAQHRAEYAYGLYASEDAEYFEYFAGRARNMSIGAIHPGRVCFFRSLLQSGDGCGCRRTGR